MAKKPHEAVWTGPETVIPREPAVTTPDDSRRVNPGDKLTIDPDTVLGGEDVNYRITGGPEHARLTAKAKDQGVSGYTKMSRLELANAIEEAEPEVEE